MKNDDDDNDDNSNDNNESFWLRKFHIEHGLLSLGGVIFRKVEYRLASTSNTMLVMLRQRMFDILHLDT